MDITAHFIDDSWKLQSHISRFIYVPAPHDKDTLCGVLLNCLLEWNLERRISTITVDNFSTNNAMMTVLLNEKLCKVIFPAVLDIENPEFKRKLDRMVKINTKLIATSESDDIPLVKNFKKIPLIAALASELLAMYLMEPLESVSVDFAEFEPQLIY
ncbi:hypothetical protein P3S68_003518 [Capsicum galapagoense]